MKSIRSENPFTSEEIIALYHTRAMGENKKKSRPKSISHDKIIENLNRVVSLYKEVLDCLKDKIRHNFIYDDKKFQEVINKINSRIDNKVRTDSQGTLSVNIGNKYLFTGTSKEYEKYFNSSKKMFNLVLKSISKEILDVINNSAFKESGKSIKFDYKN